MVMPAAMYASERIATAWSPRRNRMRNGCAKPIGVQTSKVGHIAQESAVQLITLAVHILSDINDNQPEDYMGGEGVGRRKHGEADVIHTDPSTWTDLPG